MDDEAYSALQPLITTIISLLQRGEYERLDGMGVFIEDSGYVEDVTLFFQDYGDVLVDVPEDDITFAL